MRRVPWGSIPEEDAEKKISTLSSRRGKIKAVKMQIVPLSHSAQENECQNETAKAEMSATRAVL